MDKEHTVKLGENDWAIILATLDYAKENKGDREDSLELQRIITTIKQQIKEQIIKQNE